MEKICRSCRQSITSHAKVCPHCGAHQTLSGRLAEVLKWTGGIATVISLILGVNTLISLSQAQLEKREAVQELAMAANQLRIDGDYARAWNLYQQANDMDPGTEEVRRGQETLVKEWLPNIHITGDETFTAIVDKTLPVLMRALVRSSGQEAADIQALVGWAHYLEQRERPVGDTDVPSLYQRALQIDPDNAYANAFLGHWYFSQNDNLEQGVLHFERALKRGEHREFVRNYQWTGINNFLYSTRTGEPDHIAARKVQLTMLSQMLENNEPWVTGTSRSAPREIIDAYGQAHRKTYDWFEQVLPVLTLQQHIQLVEAVLPYAEDYDFLRHSGWFLLGRLYEQSGDDEQALRYYGMADKEITSAGQLRKPLDEALKRLTGVTTKFAQMREDPLAFHGRVLVDGDFFSEDYLSARNYFKSLIADIQYQRRVDRVVPAIEYLSEALPGLNAALRQEERADHQDKLRVYYTDLSIALGDLLLYNRSLDKAVEHLEELSRDQYLAGLERIKSLYNLACALSLRSVVHGPEQQPGLDREQAVASLLRSIELGFDDWDQIKRDADLDAIREHPDYIRVMTGR